MNEYCLIIINKTLYFIEIALAFNLMYLSLSGSLEDTTEHLVIMSP